MSYPSIQDEDFYNKLYNKKEIYETKIVSDPPKRRSSGISLEPHQVFARNYTSFKTPYDSLLLFHQVGTGKTCSAIAIAEGMKQNITRKNKILVMVKNKLIETNFKNELKSEFCTGDTYLDAEQRNTIQTGRLADKRVIITAATKKINQTYEFVTFKTFVNRTIGRLSKDKRRVITGSKISDISHRTIIIDEAHNLTLNEGYTAIRTLLNKSVGCKIILLTATPIFDSLTELPEILNLLYPGPHKNLLPTRKNLANASPPIIKRKSLGISKNTAINIKITIPILTDHGKEIIKKSAKGRISYLRVGKTNFPDVKEKGEYLRNRIGSIRVIKCEMSPFQYKSFQKAIDKDKKKDNSVEAITNEDESPVAFKNISDASTFVFPDGSFGKTGFNRFTKKSTSTRRVINMITKRETIKEFTEYKFTGDKSVYKLKNLEKYSSKFAEIIKTIEKSNGPVFVFSGFVTEGGISLLALILEENGYIKYSNATKSSRAKKYMVLDGSVPVDIRERNRKTFNDPKNKDGNIIKVILGSPAVSEGITLKNVRQVHLVEPPWNMSRISQVIGRAARNFSHQDLPEKDRKVDVYKYVASSPKGEYTIDELKYIVCEEKDRAIKEAERILKKGAVDCSLNRLRNILPPNLFKTSICDYDTCSYRCDSGPVPNGHKLDDRNYLSSIPPSELQLAKKEISSAFKKNSAWTIDDLSKSLKHINSYVIYAAMNDIINSQNILEDKYGREGGIIYRGEYYILQPYSVPDTSDLYTLTEVPKTKKENVDSDKFFKDKYPEYYNKIQKNRKEEERKRRQSYGR